MHHVVKNKFLTAAKIIAFYILAVYIGEMALVHNIIWPTIHWLSANYPDLRPSIQSFTQLDYGRIIGRIFSFIGVSIIYLLFVKFIDKSSLRDSVLFPKSSMIKFFILGCLLGALMVFTTIVFTLITESVSLTPLISWKTSLPSVIILYLCIQLLTAATEELIMRGYVLKNLAEIINPNVAVILTSLIFGYWHVQYSFIYGSLAFIFGLIAGYGFIFTRNLYFCIGMHFAWNCIESIVYSQTLFNVTVHNVMLAGDKNITPDQQGLFALPSVLIGLAIVLKMKKDGRY